MLIARSIVIRPSVGSQRHLVLSPCLEAVARRAGLGIGDNAINIIIQPHLISVCRKTRLIFITINVFITWTQ